MRRRAQGRSRLALRLDRQLARHSRRRIMRRRTSTLQRNRHIDSVELPLAKHKLVGRLHLIRTIPDQLRHDRRRRVSRQRAHAGVALRVRAEGVVEFARSDELYAKVGRHHRIRRRIQREVRFHRSCVHAEHQVVAILRRSHRQRRSRADAHFAATRQPHDRRIRRGRDGRADTSRIARERQRTRSSHRSHNRRCHRPQSRNRRRSNRTSNLAWTLPQMHHEPVSRRVPCVRSRRLQVDDDARDRRVRLKLVRAQRGDLIGIHLDALLHALRLPFQRRVRQVDHDPRRIADYLNRRNQRLSR